MISRVAVRLKWLRWKAGRSHWAARLLGIRTPQGEADEPGLIMIQIDGLSRAQLERALENGKLRYLGHLIRRGHFTLKTFYPGVPSTTPAVQGEIFFGVRAAVPGFEFLRRKSGKILRMYDPEAAAEVEAELEKACPDPLLKGGHTYANIYRAGARRSRYCSRDSDLDLVLKRLHPFKGLILSIAYLPRILRMAALTLIEIGLAVVDAIGGFQERESLFKELAFVPARVLASILMRELIRFRVLLDIELGVKLIHMNFLGYDEQAHRRGPDSAFAHWTLKGIDRAVRDICRAAGRSRYRDYEWIVYSDHGQERTIPYAVKYGRELETAFREVFARGPLAGREIRMKRGNTQIGETVERARHFFGMKPATGPANGAATLSQRIVVTAMGPLGHVYLPEMPSASEIETYARDLVQEAGVPLVLRRTGDGVVHAFNRRGSWILPVDRDEIIGAEHPFPDEVTEDLIRLCAHPDAGDLVISGWDPQQAPLSFAMENGAHGGPGYEETQGFILVPDRIRRWHVAHLDHTLSRIRGDDLRQIALHFLNRDGGREERVPHHPAREQDLTVRVMTYNIHSCRGLDGKVRPERIARVINHFDPDIIAVQEVDSHRVRSGGQDQSRIIADHLRMEHVFHAMLEEEKERYGIAIFSKYPFTTVKSCHLTAADRGHFREARGAIWVKLEFEGRRPFHFINTHFGLRRSERQVQADELLGANWLGEIPESEPVILCGDFNAGPDSAVVRKLRTRFRDVQLSLPGHRPRATFLSLKPLFRIDHVFVSRHFEVNQVALPDTPTAVMASDHLPLCVELTLHANHESP